MGRVYLKVCTTKEHVIKVVIDVLTLSQVKSKIFEQIQLARGSSQLIEVMSQLKS